MRWLGPLAWLAVLPLAGAALIFWTVYRLQQDSVLRVRELEQSRARAVDDSAARLRRIERDLHDGAQAQMVAVAMKLGLAKEKLDGMVGGPGRADLDRALELVDAAHRGAKEAITELRDLARGIHPPVLDHGLGAALTTLAARSDAAGRAVVDLPERPSAAIETIAYFWPPSCWPTSPSTAAPGMPRWRRCMRLACCGCGSATTAPAAPASRPAAAWPGWPSGSRTVDGRLQVSSPPGGPTVVTVELPSHA